MMSMRKILGGHCLNQNDEYEKDIGWSLLKSVSTLAAEVDIKTPVPGSTPSIFRVWASTAPGAFKRLPIAMVPSWQERQSLEEPVGCPRVLLVIVPVV